MRWARKGRGEAEEGWAGVRNLAGGVSHVSSLGGQTPFAGQALTLLVVKPGDPGPCGVGEIAPWAV